MRQKRIFVSAAILLLALMVAFPAAGLLAGESSTDTTDLSTTESSVREAYGKLPLLFIENQGQVDEVVRYYTTSSGQTVYFTEENMVFDLIRYDGADATADRQAERLVFSVDFLGANSQPFVESSGKDGAVVNYFIGNDPEKWHTNIPTCRELVYRDIYPNIDLRLYGNGGMLRYDFIVNPGATPEAIALAYNGIDSLAIEDGELVIGTAFGDIVQSQPYIYQQIGDEVVEVEGCFRLGSDNTYGFHAAVYNNHYPLVIDPMLLDYSTYLGGEASDMGSDIALDSGNYAYVTGTTYSPHFPITPKPYDKDYNENGDVFVTKLLPDGSDLVYSTYLGGEASDMGNDIAVDSDNNAYVTGVTMSIYFPTTPGAFQVANAGVNDAFVTKLSPDGRDLVYSTYLGGEGMDCGNGIALDTGRHAYVTGGTWSSRFPTTPGAFQVARVGFENAFVTKLSPDGSALAYSTYLGGGDYDRGNDIAVDSDNYAYVTGETSSGDFPTTPGAFQVAMAGPADAFVTKLSKSGSAPLVYSTYLGGERSDTGYGIALDSDNYAHVTGGTYSVGFPTTPGAFQVANAGGWDAFVTKLSKNGSAPLAYSTYLGGEEYDTGLDIAVDSDNHAYITGVTASIGFPPISGVFPPTLGAFPTTPYANQTANAGGHDAFVTKLSKNGSAPLLYSTYLGGEADDGGAGIAVNSDHFAYVTGETSSGHFPTTPGAWNVTTNGASDAFVTKIIAAFALTINSTPGGTITTPGVGTYTYDAGTEVDLVAVPAAGYNFTNWTPDVGTIADVNSATTIIIMNCDYSITANFARCFIATAVYGTPMAQEIQILREFRDEYLLTNPVGKAFVDFYYRISPPLAEFITEHPSLKPIVRAGLLPVIGMSYVAVNTTPAQKMAISGLVVLVSVALAVLTKRRRGRSVNCT